MAVDKPDWLDIDFLANLKHEGEQHPSRVKYIGTLRRHWLYFRGSSLIAPVTEFDDMEIPEGQAVARQNKIQEIVSKLGSIFMKNVPVVRRWPLLPEDADIADDIDALYLQAWEDSEGQFVTRNMLEEAQVNGLSIGKIYWDASKRDFDNNGAIGIQKLSPYSVLVDPWASNEHRGRDAGYIFHTTEQPVGALLARYGDEARKALSIPSKRGRTSKKSGGGGVFKRTIDAMKHAGSSTGSLTDEEGNREPRQGWAVVTEAWLFPQVIQSGNLTTGNKVPDDRFKYGMVVTVINDTIVRVMKNPFATKKSVATRDEFGVPKTESKVVGHRRSPFVPIWWSRTADTHGESRHGFYDCMGMVEQMISLQVNINANRRNISINGRSMANPSIVANEDALVSPVTNIQQRPSQIHLTKQNFKANEAIHILQGAPMPNFVFEMLAADLQAIEKQAGLEAGVIGLFPQAGGTSHTPGVTVGALQEAAFGPLWKYVAELAAALLDMSILYDGLIQQKYEENRFFTVTRNGAASQVQFTGRHATAHFRRGILQGATTPLADIDKLQRTEQVVAIVQNAIMSQNPSIMELGIAHIESLNYPWALQFQQILAKELQRTLQIQQGVAGIGAGALQQAGQQPLQLPVNGGGTDEDQVINALAQMEGRDPAEIALAIEAS
jgi:hypothetical protein